MSTVFTINQFEGKVCRVFRPEPVSNVGWKLVEERPDGFLYQNKSERLTVIVSGEVHDDRKYLHVSCSNPFHVPTYDQITFVKQVFVGDDREAYMVFPMKDKHVNIHPYCLHLYSPDEPVLPDFTGGAGSI